MENSEFSLNSREEIEKFDNFLSQYAKEKGLDLPYISLIRFYDAIQIRDDRNRLFTAFLDIKINFLLLSCDIRSLGSIWNEKFSKGKLENGSILDGKEKFFGKMDIHRFSTSFIFRYRALWDKIMGLLILLMIPKKYDAFCNVKSKRKYFKKSMNELNVSVDVFNSIDEVIEDFDNSFRTAEAHGTGSLRKYSFLVEPMNKNPQLKLINHWSIINVVISSLDNAPMVELDKIVNN